MRRLLNTLFRTALGASIAALVLAVLRWGPVYAAAPWNVRAMPAAGAAVCLAVACALTGVERPRRRLVPLAIALFVAVAVLALVVEDRGPAGLSARVTTVSGVLPDRPRGPVDISGQDLDDAPHSRKWWITWDGVLRVPHSGTYQLWVDGRGEVDVRIDGRPVLRATGERFRNGAPVALGRGDRRLQVSLERIGRGPRLRLGWTRPDGLSEVIPPRHLIVPGAPPFIAEGAPSRLSWRLTDILALAVALLAGVLVALLPWDRPREEKAPAAATRRELLLGAAGYTVLIAAMSWPLVLDPGGHGMVDRPDGRLNAWILAWDVHALRHGRPLWDAPAFHPMPDALAYSENLLLPALVASPALVLGGPVLGYNFALLLSLVASGLAAQLLARRVCADPWAAFVAGAFFAAGAHRWIRLAHLQSQVTVFLPLALWAFDRWLEKRTVARALVFGALLGLQGLSSVYVGAITAMAAAIAAGLAVFRLSWADRARLLLGFALAAAMVAPVGRAYLRMRAFQGMEWTLSDVATYATTLESYVASGTRLYGDVTQRHLDPDRVRDTLFPGVTLLVAGLAGLAAAPRRYRVFAIVASLVAVVFSLGPETAAYRWLHEHLVLVRGVRALSRFSLIPVLCLSVLGGLAVAGRRRVAVGALVLFLVESSNVPIRYAAYDGPSDAARWLARGAGAVVHLPLGEDDTGAMLDGTAHWRPLVNGDSGFIPRSYSRAMELLEGTLGDEGLRFLRAAGVRHVVTADEHPLPVAARFGVENVYEVPPGETAQVVPAAPVHPTTWEHGAIVVDLGEVREVRRVVFEADDRPWVAAPVVALSNDGREWTSLAGEASLADATLSLMRDPRHGAGEVRFPPTAARYVRLPAELPARPGLLQAE